MIVRIKKADKDVNWGAKDQKTGKLMSMFENCKDKLVPGLDKDTGILKTGLDEKTERRLEKAMGLEKEALSKAGHYWSNFSIVIPEDGLTLNTEGPLHELQYLVLKADPEVAMSYTELRTSSRAKYVLTSDEAEASVSNTRRSVKTKAYSIFGQLSPLDVKNALFTYGLNPQDMSNEVAEDRLGEKLESDPAKFLKLVGDTNFKEKAWFMKLIKEGIVTKHGKGVGTDQPLYFDDIALGKGLDEAIAFVKNKENSKIALGLKKLLAE
jgi:hypothetical protein